MKRGRGWIKEIFEITEPKIDSKFDHYKIWFQKSVLVYSGCYDQHVIDLVAHDNRNLFPTVLEAENSKIEKPADLVSEESRLPGAQMAVREPRRMHMAEGVMEPV